MRSKMRLIGETPHEREVQTARQTQPQPRTRRWMRS